MGGLRNGACALFGQTNWKLLERSLYVLTGCISSRFTIFHMQVAVCSELRKTLGMLGLSFDAKGLAVRFESPELQWNHYPP